MHTGYKVLVVVAVLLGAACGGPPATQVCGPTNCDGCCDAAGACQAGVVDSACGRSGAACASCSSGLVCSVGACTPRFSSGGGSAVGGGSAGGAVGGGVAGGAVAGGAAGGAVAGGAAGGAVAGGAAGGAVAGGSAGGAVAGGAAGGATAGGAAGGAVAGGAAGGAVAGGAAGGAVAGGAAGGAVAGGSAGGAVAGGSAGGAVAGGAAGGAVAGGSAGGAVAGGSAGGAVGGGAAGGAVAGGSAGGAVGGGSSGGGSGTCDPVCPGGFACTTGGFCSGGNLSGLILNVLTFQATGTVLLNGMTPTSACSSAVRATVRFTEAAKGYSFAYDVPCPPGGGATGAPFTFSGAIYPGTYRVTVSGGFSNMPSQSFVVHEALPVTGNVNPTLNVVTHQAGGTVLLNGINPTSACSSAVRATVRFTDSAKGYAFAYDVACPPGGGATGAPFTFNGPIFPGTYRVTVSGGFSNLPSQPFVISESFPVAGDVLGQTLNVVTHQAGGTVLLNGANPTSACSSAVRATVRFTDSAKGYTFAYDVACPPGGGATGAPFTFSGAIYPGTYRVTVSGGFSNLPSQPFVISESFSVTGDVLGQSLNVVTHQAGGTVLLNGANPTSACSSAVRATVRFTDALKGYAFAYDVACPPGGGATGAPFTFSGAIYPGTYRVTVSGGFSNLPSQPFVINEAFPVTGAVLNQVLDVITFQAGGTVLLNGVNPTSACSSAVRATVRFTDDVKGYAFAYDVACPPGGGATGAPFTFSGAIYPGTYRVTVGGGFSNLPSQQYVVSTAFPVAGNVLAQTLNVLTVPSSGSVLLNGFNPTSACSSAVRATVRFTDAAKGYSFAYDVACPPGGGATGAPFTFSGPLFPGTYVVTVTGGFSNLPSQPYLAISALIVP
ncbi:MAG: hypothetical protein Q8L14_00755 [Myxococcales bacterium]|nr:hypothetical protein [Myxococcales bacterium]